MELWHISFSTRGRLPFFTSEEQLRHIIRMFIRLVGGAMVLFCIIEEHIHLLADCSRLQAGQIRRVVHRFLSQFTTTPIASTWLERVESRAHLRRLVNYFLQQPEKHLMGVHSALWTGSCFQDLIGARFIHGLQLKIFRALPQYRLREAHESVGLPQEKLVPYSDSNIRKAGVGRLKEVAACALCVNPSLTGNDGPVVLARRTFVQLSKQAGISSEEVAWALGITTDAVRRLSAKPYVERAKDAVRLRLSLEDAAG